MGPTRCGDAALRRNRPRHSDSGARRADFVDWEEPERLVETRGLDRVSNSVVVELDQVPRKPWLAALPVPVVVVAFFYFAVQHTPIWASSLCRYWTWDVPFMMAVNFAFAGLLIGAYSVLRRGLVGYRVLRRRRAWDAGRLPSSDWESIARLSRSRSQRSLLERACALRARLDAGCRLDTEMLAQLLEFADQADESARTDAGLGTLVNATLGVRLRAQVCAGHEPVCEALAVDRLLARWLDDMATSTTHPVRL